MVYMYLMYHPTSIATALLLKLGQETKMEVAEQWTDTKIKIHSKHEEQWQNKYLLKQKIIQW